MRAISSLTFAPGRIPPLPGFAPWLSLISNIFTVSCAATSRSLSSSRLPSRSRTPFFAVPIWNTMSAPPSRWYGESPPSPVFIQQPAIRAPFDSASTAGFEIAPKLIPEMLTIELVVYGTRHAVPIVTGCGSTASSDSVGYGQLTKMIVPFARRSRVEPNAVVLSTFFAAR